MPSRLRYCEGFEIVVGEERAWTRLTHHARVLDTVTGQLHEVTPHHEVEGVKHIYRTFHRDELVDSDGEVITDAVWWTPQLTFKAQYDLLSENGCEVELWAVRDCRCITNYRDTCHCGMAELIKSGKAEDYTELLVDMSEEDMTLTSYFKDADGPRYAEMNDGWQYEWRLSKAVGSGAVRT